jgi:hypothetical protein
MSRELNAERGCHQRTIQGGYPLDIQPEPFPAPENWSRYDGAYWQDQMRCVRVIATPAGLEMRYQAADFPYELTRARLMPKPEWDDGYFIGAFRGKLIWFGDLATPNAVISSWTRRSSRASPPVRSAAARSLIDGTIRLRRRL